MLVVNKPDEKSLLKKLRAEKSRLNAIKKISKELRSIEEKMEQHVENPDDLLTKLS